MLGSHCESEVDCSANMMLQMIAMGTLVLPNMYVISRACYLGSDMPRSSAHVLQSPVADLQKKMQTVQSICHTT